jgi:hypothetical protein
MNDHSAGWSPDSGDDDYEGRRLRSSVERTLMDRARQAAERDRQKGPRRLVQSLVALVAAVGLVSAIMFGFDAFLTSVQKVMRMLEAEEARQEQQQQREQAPPQPGEPMPAYVVPED